jgi:tetratricopeptide (TPR) repeat protein
MSGRPLKKLQRCPLLLAAGIFFIVVSACRSADFPESFPQQAIKRATAREGRKAASVAEMLALPSKEIDLGVAALLLSAEMRGQNVTKKAIAEFDLFAASIARQIGRGANTREAIAELSELVLGGNIKYIRNRDLNDFDIRIPMRGEGGNCLNSSLLFLALADRMDLSLHAVMAPGHVFIRYDDGERRFNIEPTSGGRRVLDLKIRRRMHVSAVAEGRGIYMRSLSHREFLAELLAARAAYWVGEKEYRKAADDLAIALAVLPSSPVALVNQGFLAEKRGQHKLAAGCYRQVLLVDPWNALALNNLAGLLANGKLGGESKVEQARLLVRAALKHTGKRCRADRAAIFDTAARIEFIAENWQAAAKLSARAATLAPDRADYSARSDFYAARAAATRRKSIFRRRRSAEGDK